MNKIIITGRFTKDPEIYETTTQTKVIRFSLAVKRPFKNSKGEYDTDFFNCVSFISAEHVKQYCHKGDLVLVDGRLQNRTYDDDKGNKHYITEIVCNKIEFLSKATNSTDDTKTTENEPKNESIDNTQIYADFGDSIEISDDDIAF